MAGLIDGLIDILCEQNELYTQLLEFSKEKKDMLIKNDIDSLQKINSSESIIVGKSQRLERSRISIMRDIASVLNQSGDDLTVSELSALIEGQPEHKDLVIAGDSLRETVEDLKKSNDLNRVLIQNSLDYVEFSMNVMHSSVETAPSTYDNRADDIDNNRAFFDAKQ